MTKALRSIKNDAERQAVIARRLKAKTGGLGFLSAQEAAKHEKAAVAKAQAEAEAQDASAEA